MKYKTGYLFFILIFAILIPSFPIFLDIYDNHSNNDLKLKTSKTVYNTVILRPDGDIESTLYGWYCDTYTRINDNVVQPNAGDGLPMTSSTTGAYTIFSMTNFILPSESVGIKITIWIRGLRTLPNAHIPSVAYQTGTGIFSLAVLLPFIVGVYEWRSVSYTDLSLTQLDIDDLMVKFTTETEGDGYPKIDTVYIELVFMTYTPDEEEEEEEEDIDLPSNIDEIIMIIILSVCIFVVLVLVCFITTMKNRRKPINNNRIIRVRTD